MEFYIGYIQQTKCKNCPVKEEFTNSGVREIFEPANDLRWKIKADYQSPEGKLYYKKRANLNETRFESLRNAHNFQKTIDRIWKMQKKN